MGSETRKRHYAYPVRLRKDELDSLKNKVEMSGVNSVAEFMRNAALAYPIASKSDERILIELMRLRGEIGKIGGLFKLYIDHTDDNKIDAEKLEADFSKLHEDIKKLLK